MLKDFTCNRCGHKDTGIEDRDEPDLPPFSWCLLSFQVRALLGSTVVRKSAFCEKCMNAFVRFVDEGRAPQARIFKDKP